MLEARGVANFGTRCILWLLLDMDLRLWVNRQDDNSRPTSLIDGATAMYCRILTTVTRPFGMSATSSLYWRICVTSSITVGASDRNVGPMRFNGANQSCSSETCSFTLPTVSSVNTHGYNIVRSHWSEAPGCSGYCLQPAITQAARGGPPTGTGSTWQW